MCMRGKKGCFFLLTFCLNLAKSAGVNVSALAITGIKFTREPRRFITSISKGRNLIKRGKHKNKGCRDRSSFNIHAQ